jgi:CubicO group peptidase (beta-lactamase class C family)
VKRYLAAVALLFALGALVYGVALSPLRQQMKTGAGLTAKQLCTLEFVSGLDPQRARALYIDPMIREAASILHVETDAERQTVTARFPGLVRALAIHRPGYGCTLELEAGAKMPAAVGDRPVSPRMLIDLPHRDAVFDGAALARAIDTAFREIPGPSPLNTLAVVVLHDGKLVAERYAAGITPDTRLPGWSMTKSITATLVGILAEQGRLDVHAPGAIREWRGTDDPRAEVALDHLLRMTSGLSFAELGDRGNGRDPTSLMLYHEPDAAAYAASQPLEREIASHFEYMSGNTVLAMRRVQEAVGGSLRDAHAFVQTHLFDPLSMQSALIEPDQAGTFLGSTHMVASARDWARFGQLYVDRGMAGTRRLFSEHWIDYVTTPTRESLAPRRGDVFWEPGRSSYGAGFWLFPESSSDASEIAPLPGDTFDANGFQGQYLHIIPSKRLVVVRLGATNFRGHDHERLPREVLAAMKRGDWRNPL